MNCLLKSKLITVSALGIGLFVGSQSSARVLMRSREVCSKLNLGSNVAKPDSSREIINSCRRRSVQVGRFAKTRNVQRKNRSFC